jgi:hypothetical protein
MLAGQTHHIPQRWWQTNLEWQTEVLVEKFVLMPLCLPLIPHGLPWYWTWASMMRSQHLTAWAMAQPGMHLNLHFNCMGLSIPTREVNCSVKGQNYNIYSQTCTNNLDLDLNFRYPFGLLLSLFEFKRWFLSSDPSFALFGKCRILSVFNRWFRTSDLIFSPLLAIYFPTPIHLSLY